MAKTQDQPRLHQQMTEENVVYKRNGVLSSHEEENKIMSYAGKLVVVTWRK